MIRVGVIGCGLQAATIVSYLDAFGDEYAVRAVVDINRKNAEEKLAMQQVKVAPDCRFYHDLEEYLASPEEVDAYVIGTFCHDHTPVACALEKFGKPIYVEKPVAVDFEQVQQLYDTFSESKTPVTVSLPMRVCPLIRKARELIQNGAIGKINQIVGVEDTDGTIYFGTWFRETAKTGGMFLQKAVHDLDYLFYLADSVPESVYALSGQLRFGGDKPADLTCDKCSDAKTCPYGPLSYVMNRGDFSKFDEAAHRLTWFSYKDGVNKLRYCLFSKAAGIEDVTESLIKLKNGVHLSHTQNFTVSSHAGRRQAKLIGDKGVMEIFFTGQSIRVLSSVNGSEENYKVDHGQLSHYGGDRFMVKEFLDVIKTGKRSSTDLIFGNGLYSTLAGVASTASAKLGRALGKEALTLEKGRKPFCG